MRARAIVRFDGERIFRQLQAIPRLENDIESPAIETQIRQLEIKLVHFHAADAAHGRPLIDMRQYAKMTPHENLCQSGS